jgi:hypothetical protein
MDYCIVPLHDQKGQNAKYGIGSRIVRLESIKKVVTTISEDGAANSEEHEVRLMLLRATRALRS